MPKRRRRTLAPKRQTPREVIRKPQPHWLNRFERERERADEEIAARLATEREQTNG